MKCTDITHFKIVLRKIAVKELEKAISLLPNKEYHWEDHGPLVNCVNDSLIRIEIKHVTYGETLHLEGRDTDSCQPFEISVEDLSPQDIFFIIETIPAPEGEDVNVSTDGLQKRLNFLCEFMKTV